MQICPMINQLNVKYQGRHLNCHPKIIQKRDQTHSYLITKDNHSFSTTFYCNNKTFNRKNQALRLIIFINLHSHHELHTEDYQRDIHICPTIVHHLEKAT